MADREKVVKALELCAGKRECAGPVCPYWDFDDKDVACRTQIDLDALELLKKQEWIPVTERLPEVRHAVLCYSPHHINIWALSLHEDGEWYYWIPMYQKYNPDFEGPITHWMPLPEPPKEGR